MDPLPGRANAASVLLQNHLDVTQTNESETIVFAQSNRPAFAVHREYCLTAISYHVDVRRAMVIGVNHDT